MIFVARLGDLLLEPVHRMSSRLLLQICAGVVGPSLVLPGCVDRAVADTSVAVRFVQVQEQGWDRGEGARILVAGNTVTVEDDLPAPERCLTLSSEVLRGPPGELLVRIEAVAEPWPCTAVHPAPRYRLELRDVPASVGRLRVVLLQRGADGRVKDTRTRLVSLPNAPAPSFR
ncbi:MAG: hypothetical protein EA350_15480 [Gemmatimonadales bacterium]|nr:MAG: hypothetical protein EA350_15480 [Gemmatimonadales bacterium]